MAPTNCELCGIDLTRDTERAMRACETCANKLGIIPMPPLARVVRPCGRCNGLRFLRSIPREFTSADSGDANTQVISPMYVTVLPPTIGKSWLVGTYLKDVDLKSAGVGLLETMICTACGAVEWTCLDVAKIPAHPHLMTEIVDLTPGSPHRD